MTFARYETLPDRRLLRVLHQGHEIIVASRRCQGCTGHAPILPVLVRNTLIKPGMMETSKAQSEQGRKGSRVRND